MAFASALAVLVAGCGAAQPAAYSGAASPTSDLPQPRESHPTSATIPPGTPRPYAGRLDEYLPLLGECLRQAGWNAIYHPETNELSVEPLPADQQSAYQAAEAACWQVIGVPPGPESASPEEIAAAFQYQLVLRACLVDLGYAIGEPPSEDAYADSWLTGPWGAYGDLPEMGQQEWQHVNQACPQHPGGSGG